LDIKINLDLHIIDYNIVSRSASYDHQVVLCTLEWFCFEISIVSVLLCWNVL